VQNTCSRPGNLAMEPPSGSDSESVRDEKVKVLRAIAPPTRQCRPRANFAATGTSRACSALARRNFAALRLADQIVALDGVPFFTGPESACL